MQNPLLASPLPSHHPLPAGHPTAPSPVVRSLRRTQTAGSFRQKGKTECPGKVRLNGEEHRYPCSLRAQ
jgi:hypothetical protein